MKIIHLTDLHLKVEQNDINNRRFRKVVERLNGDDFNAADHIIIITGDLIENAYRHNALTEAKMHIDSLLPKFSGRIFICPGNHDFGSFSGGNAQHIQPFLNTFSEYMKSSSFITRSDYVPVGSDHLSVGTQHVVSPFPVVNIVDDCVLIGLDTMEGEFAWDGFQHNHSDGDLGAEGALGERQLESLSRLLCLPDVQARKVVIYLHHHPYKNHLILNRFRDADVFKKSIKDKVFALLFGHNHHFEDISDEADGVPLAVDGGSMKEVVGRHIVFRVIQLDGEEPSYTIKKSQAYDIPWS